ncbi:isochorismate lyase [Aliivibrio fischeri]|uniref:chorismate mutase n=1 Tax=Aliivibrio fischeri TaxID=668 RepID=A0A510UM56_ALIFS|nr:isochorismate lyase [Aliivibrio fischeri]MUK51040.1 isochorismate lyase [Aliivibrio fischeri]GEK15649.1 isochorismate-pyruvate lyase [Aliivibrio fischeri]
MQNLKHPNQCENLEHVRQGIDAIDHKIVQLLNERMGYVLAAAQFKPNVKSIPAPDRVAAMLQQRKEWASEQTLDESFITSLFEQIIPWFINQQIDYWRTKNESNSGQ